MCVYVWLSVCVRVYNVHTQIFTSSKYHERAHAKHHELKISRTRMSRTRYIGECAWCIDAHLWNSESPIYRRSTYNQKSPVYTQKSPTFMCHDVHMCVYVWLSVCVRAHTRTHTHSHTPFCRDVSTIYHLLTYIYIHMLTYIYIHIYFHMYVYMYAYIYIYTYVCIYMYVCICIYINARVMYRRHIPENVTLLYIEFSTCGYLIDRVRDILMTCWMSSRDLDKWFSYISSSWYSSSWYFKFVTFWWRVEWAREI